MHYLIKFIYLIILLSPHSNALADWETQTSDFPKGDNYQQGMGEGELEKPTLSSATQTSRNTSDFRIGPLIGFSLAGFNVSNDHFSSSMSSLSLGTRAGFAFGASAEMPLSDWLYFQPELLFNQKGFALNKNVTGTSGADYNVSYLDIPILFKAKLKFENFSPYLLIGPTPAIKLSSSGSTGGSNIKLGEIHNLDFGLVGGAGLETLVSTNTAAFVEARGFWGLTNIDADPEDGGLVTRNYSWLFLVGVRMGL